jgi:hypothetical protein
VVLGAPSLETRASTENLIFMCDEVAPETALAAV